MEKLTKCSFALSVALCVPILLHALKKKALITKSDFLPSFCSSTSVNGT